MRHKSSSRCACLAAVQIVQLHGAHWAGVEALPGSPTMTPSRPEPPHPLGAHASEAGSWACCGRPIPLGFPRAPPSPPYRSWMGPSHQGDSPSPHCLEAGPRGATLGVHGCRGLPGPGSARSGFQDRAAEPYTNTDLEPCPPERLPVTDTSLAAPHLSGVTPALGPPSVSGCLAWMAVLDSGPLLMFLPQPPGQNNS